MAESVRSLMFLVGGYYFLQAMGGNPGLHVQALQKFLKEVWGYNPTQTAAFFAFTTIPWMLKPIYGIISDFLPICGLRRKSYFILTGLLAAGFYGALSWFDMPAVVMSWFLFNAAVAFAFSDVLCDAVMVEKGQPLGATDRLQSAQWFSLGVAGVLIAFSKGYIAEYFTFQNAVLFSLAAPLVVIAYTFLFLREVKVQSSRSAARQAWRGIKDAVRSRPLWAVVVFIFLFQCNPNLGTVFYYYEKDVLKFSDILIGHIDTVGSIGFVAGTLLYAGLVKRWSHKKLLHAIIGTAFMGNFSYLLFRDATSGFLVTAFSSVITVVMFLGILTVAAKVCPQGAEGTVFALLMSVSNAGTQLGNIIGAQFYEALGYSWLVAISAVFTACMWFFLPLVREKKR